MNTTSTLKDGGPAFPEVREPDLPYAVPGAPVRVGGMTLRDWLAGQALAGFNANPHGEFSFHWENAKGQKKLLGYGSTPVNKDVEGWRITKTPLQAKAESMYAQADAMIAARETSK